MTARADVAFFEQILEHLQQTRGFDFTAYKRTSLMRRVIKRMQLVNVQTFEQYLDYLQVHQDEFAALFNTILINVTSFFRDPEVWAHLDAEILPVLLRGRPRHEPVRIWSAGTASGQEAYTLAMLMAEKVGFDGLRERVKIYATDADEEALNEARHAAYTDRQLADVPAPLVDKYFERSGTVRLLNRDLRRSVIFGRHDLIQDAPISHVDLLVCRNTLMYFNAETQTRILGRFFFSLNDGGFLVVGRAELLFSHAAMFTPADLKRRIFKAVAQPSQRDRLQLLAQTGRDVTADHPSSHSRLREAAFDSEIDPQLVLDNEGLLVAVNIPARERFGLGSRDIGRPFQDLEISYRPAAVRAALERATDERRDVTIKDVQWARGGEVRTFDVVVAPLLDGDLTLLGARITFADVTHVKVLQDQLQVSKQELETAYEELQSTNEELETTNEELQSTVEELETTNEELQSTNEELETMNEELQSTNEELHTMNDELRNRGSDLNSLNAFLESVFRSLRSAVVVIDREYRIQVWNDRAEDLWGVRSEEAQQSHFLGLDIGLPVADLKPRIREVLAGNGDTSDVTLSATNRRGKPIDCRVSIAPLRGRGDKSITGAILLMDEKAQAS